MKSIFTTFCAALLCLLVQGQSILPATNSINCPGSTVNFKITIPGGGYQSPVAVGSTISGLGGSQAIQGVSAVTFQSDGTNTYFSFTGRFVDYAAPQGVYLTYVDGAGTSHTTSTFAYDHISSFNPNNTAEILSPSPSTIQANSAQSQNFTITVPAVAYTDKYAASPFSFGSVTNFEYLLPQGWSLNGVVTSGAWQPGSGSVTVTSDACHGGTIQVRAAPCTPAATPGPAASISITRPASTYTISGSASLCSGTGPAYSVNGLQAGGTVSWTVSPANIVTINSPGSVTTPLTYNNVNGLITLTANITDVCGNTTTASMANIVVGPPGTPYIASSSYHGDQTFVATASNVPGATYNWFLDGSEQSTHAISITGTVDCGTSNPLTVQAVNACATSPMSNSAKIYIVCGGGGGQSITNKLVSDSAGAIFAAGDQQHEKNGQVTPFQNLTISPNPSNGMIKVSAGASAGTAGKFYQIRVLDAIGQIRQAFSYSSGITNVDLNLGNLGNGIYIVQIFDNHSWTSRQLVIVKGK